MIGDVLPLIKTLLDIILMRKGPDAVPASSVLLLFVIALWLAIEVASSVALPELGRQDFAVGLLVSLGGLLIYAAVVIFYGKRARLQQMATAVIGCSSLLMICLLLCRALLAVPALEGPVALLMWLIILWSIAVDGHILGRTMSQPMIFGLLIALAVFFLQYYLSVTLNPPEPTAT